MKHIVKLAAGRYIHLDSYGEPQQNNPIVNALLVVIVVFIATMTAGAIVGIDITKFNTPTQHQTK